MKGLLEELIVAFIVLVAATITMVIILFILIIILPIKYLEKFLKWIKNTIF
jgi:type IV secretory pathway component VirB8